MSLRAKGRLAPGHTLQRQRSAVGDGTQNVGAIRRVLAGARAERHGVVRVAARRAGVDGRAAAFVVRVAVRVRAVALWRNERRQGKLGRQTETSLTEVGVVCHAGRRARSRGAVLARAAVGRVGYTTQT